MSGRGLLLHKNILYILNSVTIKLSLMDELHKWPYSWHSRYQKIISMIRNDLFYPNIEKRDSTIFSTLHRVPLGTTRTTTSSRVTPITTHSGMEMGSNEHEFHNTFT